MGYSLQASAKQNEGTSHPDRDGQFACINALAGERLAGGEPVISVDTKKKERIGLYANGGREMAAGQGADRDLGEFAKATPYGVYDVSNDEGRGSVGDTSDTAEFAVESIRRWWNTLGKTRFPLATKLLVPPTPAGPTATGSVRRSAMGCWTFPAPTAKPSKTVWIMSPRSPTRSTW